MKTPTQQESPKLPCKLPVFPLAGGHRRISIFCHFSPPESTLGWREATTGNTTVSQAMFPWASNKYYLENT